MDPQFVCIGLGNPGDRYAGTRHNVGFSFIDALAGARGCSLRRRLFRPLEIAEDSLGRGLLARLVLVKPLTFMNRSGSILPWLQRRTAASVDRICVVVDNMDLSPGEVRMKKRGGPSGHNGLRSVSEYLGTDEYSRIYFGIGRPRNGEDVVSHVLGQFLPEEDSAVTAAIDRIVEFMNNDTPETLDQLISGVNARRTGRVGEL
ncbi:MAG: aminoacyl-tRNA hydrolase [Alkalispirochaeta sp.]